MMISLFMVKIFIKMSKNLDLFEVEFPMRKVNCFYVMKDLELFTVQVF